MNPKNTNYKKLKKTTMYKLILSKNNNLILKKKKNKFYFKIGTSFIIRRIEVENRT